MFTTNQVTHSPTLVALPSVNAKLYQPAKESIPSAGGAAVDYLAIIFETFLDHLFPSQGLLLLDQAGSLVQSSPKARRLCQALQTAEAKPGGVTSELPREITTLAQRLIESRKLFPDQPIQLQDNLPLANNAQIHVQAEWIHIERRSPSYIMVTLENVLEVSHQRALFDAYRYNFTPRETEVWELHLQGFSYRQIAEAFVISMNTVKRHMKSIHGKRRDVFT